MEVTSAEIAQVPGGNVRIARADFAAVWAYGEHLEAERGARGVLDWYTGGVVATCRWSGAAVVHSESGSLRLARSPVCKRTTTAYEELIEAEFQTAEPGSPKNDAHAVDRGGERGQQPPP